MTRRNFIKTGLIFVPSAALAYPAMLPSSLQQRFNCNLPPTFPGLKFWIHPFSGIFKDAAKTKGCLDGDLVNTWQDANGFADFAQSIVGDQPIYRQANWSTMPSVEFGATVNTGLVATHANLAQDFSWHMVLKPNALASSVAIWVAGSVSPNFAQIACNASNLQPYLYGGTPIGGFTTVSALRTYYWSATFNGASSLLYFNGINIPIVGNIGSNGTQSTGIGVVAFAPPGYELYELAMFKPSLSDANRLLLEESFRLRYGLPIGIT